MRRWCSRCLWFTWAAIVLLVGLTHLVGENFWPFAILVYAPPQMWLIFLTVVSAASWKVARRLALLSLGTALFIAGPLWEWRTHRPSVIALSDKGATLRVLTVNRGDHHEHSMAAYVMQQQPDVIAMQDSMFTRAWVPNAPEYAALTHQSRVGEFLLLSRFPITQTQLITTPLPPYRAHFKGARFQIDFHGRPVAVYNVHLPSPRPHLLHAGSHPSKASLDSLCLYWSDHGALVEDLLKRIESESLPAIALGDWNQPAVGPRYRRLIRHLQDSHAQAGLGYGWSFPGDLWTPFTLGQAWLRLDLVLCSKDWRVQRSEVEPESESQHCAVSAVLQLP